MRAYTLGFIGTAILKLLTSSSPAVPADIFNLPSGWEIDKSRKEYRVAVETPEGIIKIIRQTPIVKVPPEGPLEKMWASTYSSSGKPVWDLKLTAEADKMADLARTADTTDPDTIKKIRADYAKVANTPIEPLLDLDGKVLETATSLLSTGKPAKEQLVTIADKTLEFYVEDFSDRLDSLNLTEQDFVDPKQLEKKLTQLAESYRGQIASQVARAEQQLTQTLVAMENIKTGKVSPEDTQKIEQGLAAIASAQAAMTFGASMYEDGVLRFAAEHMGNALADNIPLESVRTSAKSSLEDLLYTQQRERAIRAATQAANIPDIRFRTEHDPNLIWEDYSNQEKSVALAKAAVATGMRSDLTEQEFNQVEVMMKLAKVLNPDPTFANETLASLYVKRAEAAFKKQEYAVASKGLRAATKLDSNPKLLGYLEITLGNYGLELSEQGAYGQAADIFEELSHVIVRQEVPNPSPTTNIVELMEDGSLSEDAKSRLALTLINQARSQNHSGDTTAFQEIYPGLIAVLGKNPSANETFSEPLALIYQDIIPLALKKADLDSAETLFSHYNQLADRPEEEKQNLEIRIFNALVKHGMDIMDKQRKPAQALELFKRSREYIDDEGGKFEALAYAGMVEERGYSLDQTDEYLETSRRLIQKALDLNPNHERVKGAAYNICFDYAQRLFRRGELKKATAEMELFLSIAPDVARSSTTPELTEAYHTMRDFTIDTLVNSYSGLISNETDIDKAIEYINKMLQYNPSEAYNEYAILLSDRLGAHEIALEYIGKAVALDSENETLKRNQIVMLSRYKTQKENLRELNETLEGLNESIIRFNQALIDQNSRQSKRRINNPTFKRRPSKPYSSSSSHSRSRGNPLQEDMEAYFKEQRRRINER